LAQPAEGRAYIEQPGKSYFVIHLSSMGVPDYESAVNGDTEANYRVDPSWRALGGSSAGGLFALYAMFAKPQLFNAVIAVSPGVLWDDKWIFKYEEGFHEKTKTLPLSLYMTAAEKELPEQPDSLESIRLFDRVLRARKYEGLRYEFRLLDDARHAGSKPEGFSRGRLGRPVALLPALLQIAQPVGDHLPVLLVRCGRRQVGAHGGRGQCESEPPAGEMQRPTGAARPGGGAAGARMRGDAIFGSAARMNADLEKLVRLHRVETELAHLESDLANVPRKRQELEARIARDRARLDGAKAALDTSVKARKQHESSVQDLETKRSKYKGQLMEVKTNKEYTAVLHEIEGVEREIRAREDQVLEEMEKAEALALDVKREEAAFKLVEQAGKAEAAQLATSEVKLAEHCARLRAEREQVASSVPEEARELYARVAKQRGTAVAEARDGVCQTCHVRMRLQVWVELRKNETLFQCESCSRVLYYEPPPPTVVAEP
jgi:predicted  nucleic acid-binding Zn-ribbon protein